MFFAFIGISRDNIMGMMLKDDRNVYWFHYSRAGMRKVGNLNGLCVTNIPPIICQAISN